MKIVPSLRVARRARSLVLAVAVLAGLAAVVPAQAATTVYEVHHVPTVGGAVIRVEILRDTRFDAARQPVLLTYSPYNTLGEPAPAEFAMASELVSQGYARAVADVIGTRGSTGCWDYGGQAEQQSGVDVVKYLAGLGWSNGSVGMIGASYDGTTATMVAARGDDVPELKAIVPIAAISRWYGYAYKDGVRYFLNSRVPTDEGFDTPLLFDAGFAKTVAADPTGEDFVPSATARAAECDAVEHSAQGYSRNPDYGPFWLERDYRKDAAKFRAAVLLVHGWQDFNVKAEEAVSLYEALPVDDPVTAAVEGVPFKRLWMTQAAHADGQGPGYQATLEAFLEQTLKGVDRGFAHGSTGAVTRGRDAAGPTGWLTETTWPPPGTSTLTLHLGRSFDRGPAGLPTGESGELSLSPQNDGAWTWGDTGTSTEEVSLRDPLNADGHGYYSLFYQSPPLAQPTRLAGAAVLDAVVNAGPGSHVTPLLVEVLPTGALRLVQRGFLNLDYRDGLDRARPGRLGQWVRGRVSFQPQDQTFAAGSRIGLILQSSNTVWAVPGAAGVVNVANGPVPGVSAVGTTLELPLVGAPLNPFA